MDKPDAEDIQDNSLSDIDKIYVNVPVVKHFQKPETSSQPLQSEVG